jgi:hypothetical protein
MTMLIRMMIRGTRAEIGINMRPLKGMEGICGHNPTKAMRRSEVGMAKESSAAKLIMLK